jgi:hypothetical protein
MPDPATARSLVAGCEFRKLVSGLLLRLCVIICMMLALAACRRPAASRPLAPLGPDAKKFYGSTTPKSLFDPLFVPSCKPSPTATPEGKSGDERKSYHDDPTLHVLTILADVNDHRFTGTPADRTSYRNGKLNDYQSHDNAYWKEASYNQVDIAFTMPDRIVQMSGAFDDYFNRTFVEASLTSNGLTGKYPLALDGSASATIHVRDAHGRNKDVVIAPNGPFPNVASLALAFEDLFKATTGVPDPWVKCQASGDEIVCKLDQLETQEGSFIRVKGGTNLATLGLDGPIEDPGNSAAVANLAGKPATYPINALAGDSVIIEIRDKDFRTRRYTIAFAAGNLANPATVTGVIVPAINAEFNWAESYDAGANRIGLRLLPAFSGESAAIRVVGGSGLTKFGLDGPTRVDGVIHPGGSNTVRGDSSKIIAEALSLYLKSRADDGGIPIDSAHSNNLVTLVQNELKNFESYMVLFVDQMVGVIPGKRAGASSGNFDIAVTGVGDYVFTYQLNGRLMVGTGAQGWQTWAHELGHNLGFWDLYKQPNYDTHFDSTFDYLRIWSIMDNHRRASDVDAWHKNMETMSKPSWIPAGFVGQVDPPPAGATEKHSFTVLPLEFPVTDYPGFGAPQAPAVHLARIKLSDSHWIQIENHQPAAVHSLELPDDVKGWAPPDPSAHPGGILVTDTVDPFKPPLYRSAVTVLNPNGVSPAPGGTDLQARGMHAGDALDFATTYPAYDGIQLRVLNEVAGPAGKPKAFEVEVERGPGDFLDLEIRPWQAPEEYGTPDIWIDWPGNGAEDYPNSDPPVGNGDPVHWAPDQSVVNWIKVRVHNKGTVMGKGVVIRAYVNDPMGMGDKGTFQPLPNSAPQDIPAGGFKDFAFEWRPKENGHTCIRAEIFTHESDFGELDLNNNDAQENVTSFSPSAGSPYEPVEFVFKVNNDFNYPIEVELIPAGLADGMDLELESAYFKLGPDEERVLHGRLFVDINKIPPAPRARRKCDYHFNLHALYRTPDALLPFGGISVDVNPNAESKLSLREVLRTADKNKIIMTGLLSGSFRSGQKVDAAILMKGKAFGGTAVTNAQGVFEIPISVPGPGPARLMLYYFGPDMASSSAGPIDFNVP